MLILCLLLKIFIDDVDFSCLSLQFMEINLLMLVLVIMNAVINFYKLNCPFWLISLIFEVDVIACLLFYF